MQSDDLPKIEIAAKRIPYLDSLRGMAAFMILIGHCWGLKDHPHELYYEVIHASTSHILFYAITKLIDCGRSSVILFFVLSGFVLSLSLEGKHTPYFSYVLKRIFRIYPVFIVVTVIAYTLYQIIGVHYPPPSDWIQNQVLRQNLSRVLLIKNLLMWGTRESEHLDIVVWSLVHEMRISLLFPFILMAVKKYNWKAVLSILSVRSS